MASVSMMVASLAGGTTAVGQQHNHRMRVVAKDATRSAAAAPANLGNKGEEGSSGRRAAMFAAAAAAVTAVVGSGVAFAEDEPKRGTLEAKKKYAPICVTMPTARACNKIA